MLDFVDPTIETARETIDYAPRPANLRGLRLGLIENTKKNSAAVLLKVSEKLKTAHGITMEVLVHKPQRAPLQSAQIAQLKGKVDFAVAGVGD